MSQTKFADKSGLTRLPYMALAAGAVAVLGVARVLTPSPSGVGTHEQLGLPACFFLKLTGLPCPSCGLTTSFAYAAHLDFTGALAAQPFGLFLFLVVFLSIPLSAYLLYRPVPVERWLYARWSNPTLYLFLVLYGLGWIYKLAA